FAAGTPLLTPDGEKPIEQFQPGDLVLAAPEDDPEGAVEPRPVLEVMASYSLLWELQVNGKTIRTTAQHPFYVPGQGWTDAQYLKPGDWLRSHDGCWWPVETVRDTGEQAPVYNLHIAEYHTYFVGSSSWGFSVWAHNAQCILNIVRGWIGAGIQGARD